MALNRHKFKTVTVGEASETAIDSLDPLVDTAVQQLAQDVLLDILAVVSAANVGTPGIAVLAATMIMNRLG